MSRFKKPLILTLLLGLVLAVALSSGCNCSVESSIDKAEELQQKYTKLAESFAMQKEFYSNLPPYAEIVGVTTDEITINLSGTGTYPVVVTLYGSSLNSGRASITGENCSIVREERITVDILSLIIEPTGSWEAPDTIHLSVTEVNSAGDIDYVTAVIGDKP